MIDTQASILCQDAHWVVFVSQYSFSKTAVGRAWMCSLLTSCQIKSYKSMLYFLLNEDTEQSTFWENTLLGSSAPPPPFFLWVFA